MIKKRPVVSVAMVTYNQENFIKQAIDSILMQKVNFDYEIVIGEDNSPDNTRNILLEYKRKYPDRFKLILRDKNVGPTKNLYDVFKNCSGKYIAILEGDDYWIDDKKLRIQVDFLNKHKSYIACSHWVSIIKDDQYISKVINKGRKSVIENFSNMYIFIKKSGVIQINSLLFRNIFYKNINRYEKIITCSKYIADYQLNFILINKGKIKILPRIMSSYRTLSDINSSYSNQNFYLKEKEFFKVIEQLKVDFPSQKELFNKAFAENRCNLIVSEIRDKHFRFVINLYINKLSLYEKLIFIVILFKRLKIFMYYRIFSKKYKV